MTQLLLEGKRILYTWYGVVLLVHGSTVGVVAVKWANHWWANRQAIVLLTAVNTAITTTNEFISRTGISSLINKQNEYGFFVKAANGSTKIHRQSLINIIMTVFASLLGGPVFFFSKRWHRFVFFVVFGFCNSFFAQYLSGIIRDGVVFITTQRLIFDLVYNGSLKFTFFEMARKPIILAKLKIFRVGWLRLKQDFYTTTCKVTLLNILGFRA